MIAPRVRLISGLVLLTYLTTHFINHALGLISLEANDGCRRALNAASEMVNGVNRLNQLLAAELAEPLKIGLAVHSGPAVVGRMGYGSAISLTAIGDTVNVARRLQDLTKEYGCELVISEQVALQAGFGAHIISAS